MRARYFSPTTGRFTQQDTYMGNNQDPISLHKYLYANANPSNMIDPSGRVSMLSLTASIAMDSILMGIRAYGIYSTASDVYNGNWDSLAEDMVLNMVSGKLLSGIYNTLSQFKFMQNMGKRFQAIIDKFKKKPLNCPIKNSFDGSTLVATENGLVPIEKIKIGDKVWAYNEANQSKSLQEVTHLIRGEGDKELVDITLSSGEIITATANHPFWEVNTQEWLDANELNSTTVLLDINDKNSTIKSLKHYQKESKVYNLTVANDHTYYVGLDGVLGHNACVTTGEITDGGKVFTEHGADQANRREFTSEAVDKTIKRSGPPESQIHKETGNKVLKYQDQNGNTVIVEKFTDKIVTVYRYDKDNPDVSDLPYFPW